MRWSGQTESDLRWEIVGRLAADSEDASRTTGHRETHFPKLKYSFSLRPLRSAIAAEGSCEMFTDIDNAQTWIDFG